MGIIATTIPQSRAPSLAERARSRLTKKQRLPPYRSQNPYQILSAPPRVRPAAAMSNRQQARDMQVEFQARFNAKQARREAQKAAKQDPILKKQIQELLKKGETQKAYQKAKILLSKQALAGQMDQIADMAEQSSRVMNAAQKNSNPEKTLLTLEQFKNQNEEYAMSNNIYQDAMTQSTSAQVPEDAVHELLGKLADDAGLELSKELNQATPSNAEPAQTQAATEPTAEEEDKLQQRLRALRA